MESRYTVRGLNRRIYYIGLTRLIRSTGRSSTFIFMPLVLIEIYNLSFLLAGALLGVATLIMAIVQLYSGRLTDRLGRRFFTMTEANQLPTSTIEEKCQRTERNIRKKKSTLGIGTSTMKNLRPRRSVRRPE